MSYLLYNIEQHPEITPSRVSLDGTKAIKKVNILTGDLFPETIEILTTYQAQQLVRTSDWTDEEGDD